MFAIGDEHYSQVTLTTTPLRYCPSRFKHGWTCFVTLSITRTWQVIWHFFLHKFEVLHRVRLPNLSETLFYSNSPIKRNHNRETGWSSWARNVDMDFVIFDKISKDNARWAAYLRWKFLLNSVPSWTYSEHSFQDVSKLPENYADQNDKLTLSHHKRCVFYR
jgi:hypothetical protein